MRKEYKLNDTFGIVCSGSENRMNVEVVMISVPWEEVVESVRGISDKDTANATFKAMVAKYKERSGAFIG